MFLTFNVIILIHPHTNPFVIDSFDAFLDLYYKQLKFKKDQLVAFDVASIEFHDINGYHPFSGFDDFLCELFKRNGGFQILNQSIR